MTHTATDKEIEKAVADVLDMKKATPSFLKLISVQA